MRCSLIQSRAPWKFWTEAAKHATENLNRTPRVSKRHPNGSSAHTRLTGLNPSETDLRGFMCEGQQLNPKGTSKTQRERSKPVRLLGYGFSNGTVGYRFIDAGLKGTIQTSKNVTWNHDSRPLPHGYTKQEDDMLTQAVNPDPRKTHAHAVEPNDSGIPVGHDDHVLRELADKSENSTITYSNPTTRHFTTLHDDSAATKPGKATRTRGNSMPQQEADDIYNKFLASKQSDTPMYVHYRQDNPKNKKGTTSVQYLRYEGYKNIRTLDDYLQHKRLKLIGAGDLKYDIRYRFCTISTDADPQNTSSVLMIDSLPGLEPGRRTKPGTDTHAEVAGAATSPPTASTNTNHQHSRSTRPTDIDLMRPETDDMLDTYHDLHADSYGPVDLCAELPPRRPKRNRRRGGEEGQRVFANSSREFTYYAHSAAMVGDLRTDYQERAIHHAMVVLNEIVCGRVTPASLAEAKAGEDWDEFWLPAFKKEIEALHEMGTFKPVLRSEMLAAGHKTKSTKVVHKWKVNRDGMIERAKCRLVVRGFNLLPGKEYFESHSSVLGHQALRVLLHTSVQTGETMSSADIGNAFVEAELHDPVYIEQYPECPLKGYPPKDYVLKLEKCLYGLPQAGREYQRKYNKVMQNMGFTRMRSEGCLFIKHDPKHGRIICGNYVDDLVCLTKSEHLRDEWRKGLERAFRKVEFSDDCDFLLGMKITRGVDTRGARYVELSNETNIEKVAALCQISDVHKTRVTPLHENTKLYKKGEEPASLRPIDFQPNFEYARVLGGILYIANTTRPDLITPVSRLSRYVADPSAHHHKYLQEVIIHAYQTKDRALRFTQMPESQDPFRLYAATDASFADCEDTKRSTLGRCLWLGKRENMTSDHFSGLIDWASHSPKTVATSTTEAETQGALECTKDIMYTRALLADLGYKQNGSTRMYVDNNATMTQIQAVAGIKRARHYVVALRKLQEAYFLGEMHACRVDSNDNIADMFTKNLKPSAFWKHSTNALGDHKSDGASAELRYRTKSHRGSEGALRRSVKARAKDTKKARSETGKREISEGGSQSQTNEPNGHRNSTASDLLFLP